MAIEPESKIWIQIRPNDLGQIIDGIEILIEQWNDTSRFLSEGASVDVVRECRDANEARSIAAHYEKIAAELSEQLASRNTDRHR